MNEIIRPLAHNLGFDSFGQLIVRWEEHGNTYSTMCADMREKTCPICGKGWEVSAESFRNQTLVNTTDEFCHRTCYYGHIAMNEAEMWHELLCDYQPGRECESYFIPFNWKKIPNEYGGGINNPWYKVEFLGYLPTLKLGRRKRVYHMSMHDLRKEQIEKFMDLVKDEQGTKGNDSNYVYIHAHTRQEAKKFLSYFAMVTRMDKPKEGSRAAELLEQDAKRRAEKATA